MKNARIDMASSNHSNIVTQVFFYGLVEGTFDRLVTISHDSRTIAMIRRIREYTGNQYEADPYVDSYCNAVKHTRDLAFHWDQTEDEIPSECRAFEDWWGMVKAGQSEGVCYEFFADHVGVQISLEWRKSVEQSMTPWQPSDWKPESQLTDEERADPNSKSAVSKTKTK
jgi:hypothetical protein